MKTKPKRKSFNWLTALNRAVEAEPSAKEYARLSAKAGNWPTCACGSLCRRLPRYVGGAPQDFTLYSLGNTFLVEVEFKRWKDAIGTFHRIEARTAELLRAKK